LFVSDNLQGCVQSVNENRKAQYLHCIGNAPFFRQKVKAIDVIQLKSNSNISV